ncbi:hypothetical protein [Lysinibacillus sp. CTST325]
MTDENASKLIVVIATIIEKTFNIYNGLSVGLNIQINTLTPFHPIILTIFSKIAHDCCRSFTQLKLRFQFCCLRGIGNINEK